MVNPELSILNARTEGDAAVGSLLETYRNYLRLLARIEIGRRLQGKVDASDLVQETFLEAHRNFQRFQGTDEPQFACWLRQILVAKVANLVRHYFGTQGRDARLEEELAADVENSSRMLGQELAASITSPSQQAERREARRQRWALEARLDSVVSAWAAPTTSRRRSLRPTKNGKSLAQSCKK